MRRRRNPQAQFADEMKVFMIVCMLSLGAFAVMSKVLHAIWKFLLGA